MQGRFDINKFFINEALIKDYLRIMHEIILDFHMKGNERLAFFRKTRYYDSFDNKTLEERDAEYNEAEAKHNVDNRKLRYLKQRRNWMFVLYTKGNRERLYLTSAPTLRELANRRNIKTGHLRVISRKQNEYYRNVRGMGKRILERYPNIYTITNVVVDAEE